MKCPFCGYEESKVIDSRPTDEGEKIRRRRECIACNKRFTTYEIIESVPVIVVAAGSSSRMKGTNKQLAELAGVPVIIKTLQKFENNKNISNIIITISFIINVI